MAHQIVWTEKANTERLDILKFWADHNQSKVYSIKLNKLFIIAIKSISKNPRIGRKTEIENVRVKIVRNYLLFYEIINSQIVILSIWDGRRNEKKLKIK